MSDLNDLKQSPLDLETMINAVRQMVGNDAEIFVGKDLILPKFSGVIIDDGEPVRVGDQLFSEQTYLVIQANLPTKLETGWHEV